MARKQVEILGIPIDRSSRQELLQQIREEVRENRVRGQHSLLATPNPEIIYAGGKDLVLGRALRSARFCVPDGIGVVWAAKMKGCPVAERIPGIELMEDILEMASRDGLKVYFLGTRPENMEAAVSSIKQRFPDLRIAGYHHGYFTPDEDKLVVGAVAASEADILFAGMGAERELKWLYKYLPALDVPLAMGVGGSFDVFGGVVSRAPKWMIKLNLEWLYRLLKEPWRWRRQLVLPLFVGLILWEKWFSSKEKGC